MIKRTLNALIISTSLVSPKVLSEISREQTFCQNSGRILNASMGNEKLSIPRHMAEMVEYESPRSEGDPSSLANQDLYKKILGFGFKTRYQDMATLSGKEEILDYHSQPAKISTWISVGVNGGRSYPGDYFLDRKVKYLTSNAGGYWFNRYEKSAAKHDGLIEYHLQGFDPVTKLPNRARRNTEDVYTANGVDGHIYAYISCGNHLPVPQGALTCNHQWDLGAQGLHGHVYALYRRDMLPNWKNIQESITKMVLRLKKTPCAS